MSYDSRLYIVEKLDSIHNIDGKPRRFALVVNMFNMGYIFDQREVRSMFRPTDCYFYDEGGDNPVLEDKYGDTIKEIPFIEMINYLEYLKEDLKNTSMSPLIQPCLDLLNAFNNSESSEKYTLLHYGY